MSLTRSETIGYLSRGRESPCVDELEKFNNLFLSGMLNYELKSQIANWVEVVADEECPTKKCCNPEDKSEDCCETDKDCKPEDKSEKCCKSEECCETDKDCKPEDKSKEETDQQKSPSPEQQESDPKNIAQSPINS